MLSNLRGSALIEALVIIALVVAMLFASFETIGMAAARLWLDHCLYGAIRCELSGSYDCRQKLITRAGLITWGRLNDFATTSRLNRKFYKETTGRISWCNSKKIDACPRHRQIKLAMTLAERDLAASSPLGY